jgi:hypothetical protein
VKRQGDRTREDLRATTSRSSRRGAVRVASWEVTPTHPSGSDPHLDEGDQTAQGPAPATAPRMAYPSAMRTYAPWTTLPSVMSSS